MIIFSSIVLMPISLLSNLCGVYHIKLVVVYAEGIKSIRRLFAAIYFLILLPVFMFLIIFSGMENLLICLTSLEFVVEYGVTVCISLSIVKYFLVYH